MREWSATLGGDRLHAVIDGRRALCGLRRGVWQNAPWLPPCKHCQAMYGVAFPAPPGETHVAAGALFFADYAPQRGEA